MPGQIPAYQQFELTVGDGALEFSREEISELFKTLLEEAAQVSCSITSTARAMPSSDRIRAPRSAARCRIA